MDQVLEDRLSQEIEIWFQLKEFEKALEHYLSYRYLELKHSDTCIDIAASGSPFATILREEGITAYSQDLVFPLRINGFEIGGGTGEMPVPDGLADALAFHCAFECFQGDSDIRFVKEEARVLKKGGRVGIVPFYVDTIHFVETCPWCDKSLINVENDAKWLWRDDDYKEPFTRQYSPEAFVERICKKIPAEIEKRYFILPISTH